MARTNLKTNCMYAGWFVGWELARQINSINEGSERSCHFKVAWMEGENSAGQARNALHNLLWIDRGRMMK